MHGLGGEYTEEFEGGKWRGGLLWERLPVKIFKEVPNQKY